MNRVRATLGWIGMGIVLLAILLTAACHIDRTVGWSTMAIGGLLMVPQAAANYRAVWRYFGKGS